MMQFSLIFFFNDTATTEIYTLSLHDALPIFGLDALEQLAHAREGAHARQVVTLEQLDTPALKLLAEAVQLLPDRKSTRLNSSHANISYAVFCLKKKKKLLSSLLHSISSYKFS